MTAGPGCTCDWNGEAAFPHRPSCERETGVADGAADWHSWTDPTDLVRWEHCSVCGVIRRRDHGNDDKPCPGPPQISLRATSDGAADPLADVRARHREGRTDLGNAICEGCGYWPCDATRVLAALDAERAETARLRSYRRSEIDGALAAVGRLRQRAERAEAAIARARAVPRENRGDNFAVGYNHGRAAALAPLETEAP